jgi:hypothetical protein
LRYIHVASSDGQLNADWDKLRKSDSNIQAGVSQLDISVSPLPEPTPPIWKCAHPLGIGSLAIPLLSRNSFSVALQRQRADPTGSGG